LSNPKVTYICVTLRLLIRNYMQRDIIHTWFLPHPPQEVWKFLTDSDLLSQWLMENDLKPIVGHKFQFRAKPKYKIGFDGIIFCEVLEAVPDRRISYSWKGGPGNGKISLDSIVTWTLTAKNGGTELLLEHTGFKGFRNFIPYLIMNKGWLKILDRLKSRTQNTTV
jgi:uncharacterized protein YndB with AHSA1/START domain